MTDCLSWQEELFSPAGCNGAVASTEDDSVELMMYRQNSSCSDVAPPPTPSHGVAEGPPEDDLGPAERGEAPPLREVAKTSTSMSCFLEGLSKLSLSLSFSLSLCLTRLLPFPLSQVSVKFGDNHRFCNIKVSCQRLCLVNQKCLLDFFAPKP